MLSVKMMRKKFQGFSIFLSSNKACKVAVATVTDWSALVHSFVFNNRKLGSVCLCMYAYLCTFLPLNICDFFVMVYAYIDPFKK